MASQQPNPIDSPLHSLYFPIPKAKWISGKNSSLCMSCNNKIVRNGFFKSGKHHCRKCGHLVCEDCSRYTLKEKRVCHECYYKYHKFISKDSDIVDPRIIEKLSLIKHHSNTIKESDCIRACREVQNEGFSAAKCWLLDYLEWSPFYDFCVYDTLHKICSSAAECCYIQRISIILKYYRNSITRQQESMDTKQDQSTPYISYGMYEFLNMNSNENMENYSNSALLNDLHHILFYHPLDNSIFNLFCDNGGCSLLQCKLIKRMYTIGTHAHKNQYSSCDSKEISTQQLLDRIHCYLYHSIDTGFRSTQTRANNDGSTEKQLIRLRDNIEHNQSKYKTFMNMNRIKNSKFVTNVISDAFDDKIISNYSFGFRFYYNKCDECNNAKEIRDNIWTGYKISEWYIEAKYENLKCEILNNNVYNLNNYEWNVHMNKVHDLFKCCKCLSLNCAFEHISSLALYTDFDVLQREFSQTYRRRYVSESIQSVKERHCEFAIWGKILSETVRTYGESIYKSGGPHYNFYHGINKIMSFKSTVAYFLCPVSTSTQLQVAFNFASNDGLVLRIDRYWSNNNVKYFDVSWISNFVAEEERLFVNTDKCVQVVSIINVQTAENYREYLSAINGIQGMVRGDMIHYKLGTVHIMKLLRALMFQKLNVMTGIQVPTFISNLFRIICDNIGAFQMDLNNLENAFMDCQYNFEFGANKMKLKEVACDIKKILFVFENNQAKWVNIENICCLFPRMRQLWIYKPYKMNTFVLSEFVLVNILSFLNCRGMMNKEFLLNCILIDHLDEKYMSIEDAIMLFSTTFAERGWTLCQGIHEHSLMIGTFAAVNTYSKLLAQ